VADFIIKCEVCDSLIDEEDLFCANCGTEAPQRDHPERVHDTARQTTCNFECSGCGASMSYDAGAGSLRCPFCGSVDLREQKDAKILAPSKVVPFAVSRDAADAAMRQWLGNGFFRPGDLAREAAVVKMTPVFVPYWIFHAKTHTYWTADTSQTPAGASADWYPMSGEHHGSYSNLLIGASGALAPGETSALCPFDLAPGVAPDQIDLENVTVEQFSVPRKYARPLAGQAIEHLEAQACDAAYIPGRARNIHANVRIESMSSEPVLLPVWIMAYRYQDRVFRFLVNGQTGRATGQAPTSWAKVLGIAALVVAAILVILACMGVFGAVLAAVGRNDRPGLGAALTFSSFRDFAAKPRKDEIAWMPWMPCPRRPVSTPPAEHGSPGGARNGPHRFPENAHKRLTEP
jgi:LSD1 subclass zinc finger protein